MKRPAKAVLDLIYAQLNKGKTSKVKPSRGEPSHVRRLIHRQKGKRK